MLSLAIKRHLRISVWIVWKLGLHILKMQLAQFNKFRFVLDMRKQGNCTHSFQKLSKWHSTIF